jgi:hypothetical protein
MTTVMAPPTLPPGPTKPRAIQGAYALAVPRYGIPRMRARYGDAFTANLPMFGRTLVISDPAEIKQLFTASTEDVDSAGSNLGRVLGPNSMFSLAGEEHRKQRKLLVPPFHGRRLTAYEQIVEDETVAELASWPQDTPFATQPSMMRITLNIILRAVFGAEGAEFAQLRELLPRMVTLGSLLAGMPIPTVDWGRWSPWGRFLLMRREYDVILDRLITAAKQDPALDTRDDVLAMMVQSRYDDGTPMSNTAIADQLLTVLSAGHETTATTLAWTVERLRRHPEVLRALVEELDAGGSALREATIIEVQRTRPVIDITGRRVKAQSYRLGRWTVPKGYTIIVSMGTIHENEALFRNARTFDPTRFLDTRPDLYQWIPFGGGSRRCLGAAFATMEMNVVLRTMLREITLVPTREPDERRHSRGIAVAPANGGRAVIRR